MNNPTRLPVTVVTGFLGAGKTTVLRHLLLHSGLRLAVLVNEFGEVGIDGALLRACGFCPEDELDSRLVELANGCLCCTVQDDFLPTMERLLERADQLDGIVVETSGLALPEPLVAAFGWPAIRTRTRVHGVVTVVDGQALTEGHVVADVGALEAQRESDPSLDHREAIEDLFEDQLEAADLVLISRSDLLTDEQLSDLSKALQHRTRPGTPCLPVAHGAVAPELLLGTIHHHHAGEHGHAHGHDHGHDHDHDHAHVQIESLALELAGSWQQPQLEATLRTLLATHTVIRLKGWLALPGKPRLLQIQAVGPRLSCWFEGDSTRITPKVGAGSLRLVLLGFGLDRQAIEHTLLSAAA